MLKITKEMVQALREAVEKEGSQLAFERKTGVKQTTLNQILNRKTNSITDRVWRDLYPFAKPYLPEETQKAMENLSRNNAFGYGSMAVGSAGNIDYQMVPANNFDAMSRNIAEEIIARIMGLDWLDAETKVRLFNELKRK